MMWHFIIGSLQTYLTILHDDGLRLWGLCFNTYKCTNTTEKIQLKKQKDTKSLSTLSLISFEKKIGNTKVKCLKRFSCIFSIVLILLSHANSDGVMFPISRRILLN